MAYNDYGAAEAEYGAWYAQEHGLPIITSEQVSQAAAAQGLTPTLHTAGLGPIGGGFDWVVGLAPAVIKTLVASGVIPAAVAAALGIAVGTADLLTPGGMVSLDPGPGLFDVGVTGPGVFSSTLPGVSGKGTPIKSWWTGTAKFYKTNLGWFAAQRKDGTIKWFRPSRHIVISKNPSISTLVRAEKRLSKWATAVYKVKTRTTKFVGRKGGK